MCEPAVGGSLSELRARVERLESGYVAAPRREAPTEYREPAPVREECPPVPEYVPEPEPEYEPTYEPSYEPAYESVYIPEEAPVAESAPVHAASSAESTALWSDILAAVEKEIPVGIFSMVSDSAGVFGVVNDDMLTVQFKTDFAKMMLNKPELLEKLRAAAERISGRTMRVHTEDVKVEVTATQADKLSGLAKFGVKFE